MARYDWPIGPREDRAPPRAEYNRRLWANVSDDVIADARQRLWEELARLAESGISAVDMDRKRWLPIGPSALLRGQATGSPMVTGRVREIKRSPDGSRIYAATASGGVWYSSNRGLTWDPLGGMATVPHLDARGRAINSLVIGCLHVDWGAGAAGDKVFAGTGEPHWHYNHRGVPGGVTAGIGILRLDKTPAEALADPGGNPWVRERSDLTGAGIWRIVATRDPDTNEETLVAATTYGLYARTRDPIGHPEWARVDAPPFNGTSPADRLLVTDVVWVPAATGEVDPPARLFIAVANLGAKAVRSAVYVSEKGAKGPFAEIALGGYVRGNRIALGAAQTPQPPTPHPEVAYALSSAGKGHPLLWRIDGTTARKVKNLPPPLFGGSRKGHADTNDQSWRNMAIAVAPDDPRRLFIGGSTEFSGSDWNASLYRCIVSGTAASDNFALDFRPGNNKTPASDATFIGGGVHADVHAITLSPDGTDVWIACDGGVFTSGNKGDRGSFVPRNNGLAVAECGFVASHPGHAGPVAAGTQDTGAIRRRGDTIWEMFDEGDGGGVQYHPSVGREGFLVSQYINAAWNGNGRFHPPVKRHGIKKDSYKQEESRSLFYSGASAVPGSAFGKARLALGTHRVWLTEDWDPLKPAKPAMAWRTLPSGQDPMVPPTGPSSTHDDHVEGAGGIVSVKWLDPGVASGGSFTGAKLLVLYVRDVVLLAQAAGSAIWTRTHFVWGKKHFGHDDIPEDGSPIDRLPMIGAWSEIAVHRASKPGTADFQGSFYVSTTGASNADGVELERMDTLWWFDGVDKFHRTGLRNDGTKAPAFSVLCDPDNSDIVYVGTAVGVWKGTIDESGAVPKWTWEMLSIGLPEAFVQDLSIHRHPTGRVKLLRAALQSRGVWELDISANPASVGRTYLRVHPLDTRQVLPTSRVNLTAETPAPDPYPRCLSPDIALLQRTIAHPNPFDSDPSEAELFGASLARVNIRRQDKRFPSQILVRGRYAAFILVHHRHVKPLPASGIGVALLKRPLADKEGDGGDILLSDNWKAALVELLVNGNDASLDDGWTRAEQVGIPPQSSVTVADTVRNPAAAVDARSPRAAVFTLDLTGAAAGTRFLLLAVLSSTADPLTAAELDHATVADLVLGCRHACARAVHT